MFSMSPLNACRSELVQNRLPIRIRPTLHVLIDVRLLVSDSATLAQSTPARAVLQRWTVHALSVTTTYTV